MKDSEGNELATVIAVNTNVAYNFNYRLIDIHSDPGHHIEWLEK